MCKIEILGKEKLSKVYPETLTLSFDFLIQQRKTISRLELKVH